MSSHLEINPVVFLGPTLPREEARKYLNATYLPPSEQGSIVRAMLTLDCRVIVLIDGAFASVPAVRHKEILWALSRGVVVYGASSMGAIRAAELAGFGMYGHGYIYRRFRRVPLIDDDEVAVAMTPAELGSRPIGEALINIRLTLRRAERCGILPPTTRQFLERTAQSMHYLERSYPRLLERVRQVLPSCALPDLERFEAWVPWNAVDQKRTDAITLLQLLARDPERLTRRSAVARFQMTESWAYDLQSAGIEPSDIGIY